MECGGLPPLSPTGLPGRAPHLHRRTNRAMQPRPRRASMLLTAHSNSDVTSAGAASLTGNTAAARAPAPMRDRDNNPDPRRHLPRIRNPPHAAARTRPRNHRAFAAQRSRPVASSVATGAAGSGFVGRSFSSDINDGPQRHLSAEGAFLIRSAQRTSEFFASSRKK